MDDRTVRRTFLALLSGVLAAWSAAPARAQAWLPPKGDVSYSFSPEQIVRRVFPPRSPAARTVTP